MASFDWLGWLEAARYWMAVLFVITVPPAISWWFLVHPLARFWRRLGPALGLTLLGLFYAATAGALFTIRDALLIRDLGFRPATALAAVPFMAVAFIVEAKRKKHLTLRILAGVPEMSKEAGSSTLLTEGIYGSIRHPRYVGFTLGTIGWALFLGYLGLYLMIAGAILCLLGIVVLEERELRERFGQAYLEYAARVPRFVPRRR